MNNLQRFHVPSILQTQAPSHPPSLPFRLSLSENLIIRLHIITLQQSVIHLLQSFGNTKSILAWIFYDMSMSRFSPIHPYVLLESVHR